MPLDTATVGKGFALWLIPEEPVFSLLAREISRLSRLYAAPKFDPHITLVGGILLPEEETQAKASLLAGRIKPFKIELGEIGYLDEYFRCVFVEIVPNNPLLKAHEAACTVFGRQDDSPFVPHISLIYGKVPVRTRKDLAVQVGWISGLACDVRRMLVYRVSGAVERWKPVKEFGLAGC